MDHQPAPKSTLWLLNGHKTASQHLPTNNKINPQLITNRQGGALLHDSSDAVWDMMECSIISGWISGGSNSLSVTIQHYWTHLAKTIHIRLPMIVRTRSLLRTQSADPLSFLHSTKIYRSLWSFPYQHYTAVNYCSYPRTTTRMNYTYLQLSNNYLPWIVFTLQLLL